MSPHNQACLYRLIRDVVVAVTRATSSTRSSSISMSKRQLAQLPATRLCLRSLRSRDDAEVCYLLISNMMADQAIQFATTKVMVARFGSVASLVISITGPLHHRRCRSADGSHVPSLCAQYRINATLITVRRISMQAMTRARPVIDSGLKKAHSSRTFSFRHSRQSVRHQRCRP